LLDYLAANISPKKSQIFLQSEIPAIAELCFLFSMFIPLPHILRNPTIKKEIKDKKLGESYPMGFLLYPVGQIADILAFKADIVPVGEDQMPHLELTREIARKFNQLYCGVDPHLHDTEHLRAGGVFPIPELKLGRVKRLVGIHGPNANGQLLKMSKSLNNAIYLSDNADTVRAKVMQMYTDPCRLKVTDPGKIEDNPLWIFHNAFNTDLKWVEEAQDKYRSGKISDVECKKKLIEVLNNFLDPIRKRREEYASDLSIINEVLKAGTIKANEIAEDTLRIVKEKIHQDFFRRRLTF
jgi:tryptophanyl-tRNA synthetase